MIENKFQHALLPAWRPGAADCKRYVYPAEFVLATSDRQSEAAICMCMCTSVFVIARVQVSVYGASMFYCILLTVRQNKSVQCRSIN